MFPADPEDFRAEPMPAESNPVEFGNVADDYEAARAKLAALDPSEVEGVYRSTFGRSPDFALRVALAEELSRRGLKVPGVDPRAATTP